MNVVATVVVALLNALGALLPQLPGLISEIRGNSDLSDGGKKVLDLIDQRLVDDEKAVEAVQPLPTPPVGP